MKNFLYFLGIVTLTMVVKFCTNSVTEFEVESMLESNQIESKISGEQPIDRSLVEKYITKSNNNLADQGFAEYITLDYQDDFLFYDVKLDMDANVYMDEIMQNEDLIAIFPLLKSMGFKYLGAKTNEGIDKRQL